MSLCAGDLEYFCHIKAMAAGITSKNLDRLMTAISPLRSHNVDMYNHSLRVGLYAGALAEANGLDVKLALHGGMAHDVGKCAVPNSVITADPFTDADREVMKAHAEAGYDHLKGTHLFSAVVAGLHHSFQEAPYGVDPDVVFTRTPPGSHAVIEQMAQLVAYADFFDAATTRGEKKTAVEVREIMRRNFVNDTYIEQLYGFGVLAEIGLGY